MRKQKCMCGEGENQLIYLEGKTIQTLKAVTQKELI